MIAQGCSKTLTGVHVPLAEGSVRCGRCGQEIPGEKEKLAGTSFAIGGVYRNYPDWHEAFQSTLRQLAANGSRFTSEDITDRVGLYRPQGQNQNNGVGALMQRASQSGLIRSAGHRPSRDPVQHGASLVIWVGR